MSILPLNALGQTYVYEPCHSRIFHNVLKMRKQDWHRKLKSGIGLMVLLTLGSLSSCVVADDAPCRRYIRGVALLEDIQLETWPDEMTFSRKIPGVRVQDTVLFKKVNVDTLLQFVRDVSESSECSYYQEVVVIQYVDSLNKVAFETLRAAEESSWCLKLNSMLKPQHNFEIYPTYFREGEGESSYDRGYNVILNEDSALTYLLRIKDSISYKRIN